MNLKWNVILLENQLIYLNCYNIIKIKVVIPIKDLKLDTIIIHHISKEDTYIEQILSLLKQSTTTEQQKELLYNIYDKGYKGFLEQKINIDKWYLDKHIKKYKSFTGNQYE